MLPAASVTKNVFSTSQAPADTTGVLAIVAASSTGTANAPGGYARSDLAVQDKGYGPLTDYGAYTLDVAKKPVVLVKGSPSYPGAMGSISKTLGTGTSTVVDNSSTPFDTYDVGVRVLTGGTAGVAGITYDYTLDGGNTRSGAQALGTSFTLTIPNTGVSFTIGAGTLAAGAHWEAFTTRPMLNDADVTTSLGALGNCRLPFEGILIDCSAGASTVGAIDNILSGWEGRGIFKFALINSRYKTEPSPATETEADYAAALTTTFANQTSIRMCVGADGAHAPSPITGWNLKRPTAMFLAARAMATQIGVDAAFVETGALAAAQIADSNGNPSDHDEDLYPNLDGLRLVALRSFAPGGPQGVYVNNPNVISPSGSAFAYLQHVRVMNRACEIAWAVLTRQLSKGVRKNLKADPVTGRVTIFEPDAALIEGLVNDALSQPLSGQVTAASFSISRTDDLNATPAIISGIVSIVALAYVKGFNIQAQFSKTIQSAI